MLISDPLNMVPKPNSGNSNAMQSISLISPTLVDQYQWNLSPELEAIAREELKETPEVRGRLTIIGASKNGLYLASLIETGERPQDHEEKDC